MALELILTDSAISLDCNDSTFTDDTVYGGAEFDRNEVAVIVTGVKKGLPDESDVPLTISGNDSDPLTDTSWQVATLLDGWYVLPMYVVPLYNAATANVLGDVVYHSAQLWKCLADNTGTEPGTDANFWEAVLIIDSAVELAANVTFNYFNYIITCRSADCYSETVTAAATKGCCGDCNDAELKQLYERLDLLLNGVYSLCNQTRYSEAEPVVRNIIHICEKSRCICS